MPYRSTTDWDRPALKRQRDPFLTRIGLLIGGIVLLIPLAMIVRPVDEGSSRVETDGLPGAVAVVQPGVKPADPSSVSTGAPDTAAAAAGAAGDAAGLPNGAADPTTAALVPVSVAAQAVEAAAVTTTTAPATTVPAVTEAPVTQPRATEAPATQAPATQAPVTTVACGQDYAVRAGDYWSGIAAAYGVKLAKLLAANNASTDTAIYPGDTVCLPAGAHLVATTTTAPKVASTAPKPTTTAPKAKPTTTAPKPAVTVPKTTTTTTTTTVPSRSYAPADIEQIIRDTFPDDIEERALQIAQRESSFKPTAKNFCCYGLFQINWSSHKSWLKDLGITSPSQLFDPTVNAQAALILYNRSNGWGPWGG